MNNTYKVVRRVSGTQQTLVVVNTLELFFSGHEKVKQV